MRPDIAAAASSEPEGPTVHDAEAWARRRLAPSLTAALDAQLLLAHALGKDRSWVLGHSGDACSGAARVTFARLVEERATGVPLAYLRGHVEWYGMKLTVNRSVLVPRPETELLLEEAVNIGHRLDLLDFADIGTGSGALAIGLARAVPGSHVTATDISIAALSVAAQNCDALRLTGRIVLAHGSLLDPLTSEPSLIVANLPYLSTDMMADLDADVRHEPQLAIEAGRDGLRLYDELFRERRQRRWTAPVVIEIDPRQATTVRTMLGSHGVSDCRVLQDYAGRDRIVVVGA